MVRPVRGDIVLLLVACANMLLFFVNLSDVIFSAVYSDLVRYLLVSPDSSLSSGISRESHRIGEAHTAAELL
jgi:hypothetical protein